MARPVVYTKMIVVVPVATTGGRFPSLDLLLDRGHIGGSKTRFIHDQIVGMWFERRENVGVAGIADQDADLPALGHGPLFPTPPGKTGHRIIKAGASRSDRSGRYPILR